MRATEPRRRNGNRTVTPGLSIKSPVVAPMDIVVLDDSTDDDGEEIPRRRSSSSSSPETSSSSPATPVAPPVREAGQGAEPPCAPGGRGTDTCSPEERPWRGSPSPSSPSQTPAAPLQRYPRFFKVFFPELYSKHLDICPTFRPNLFASLSRGGACTLEGPSGNAWRVDLVWADVGRGGLPRFERGWARFARDHDLQTGEFLVFEYRGGSCFSVIVLDASACEKPGAFLASPREGTAAPPPVETDCPAGVERKTGDQDDGGSDVGGKEGNQLRRSNRRRRSRELWDGWTPLTEANGNTVKRRRCEKAPTTSQNVAVSTSAGRHCQDKNCTVTGKESVSEPRVVTKVEMKRARKWAQAFSSAKPFFDRVLTRSECLVECDLRIPATFAKQHLLPREGVVGGGGESFVSIILRDFHGEVYHAVCYYRGRAYFIGGGWCELCKKHRIEDHDTCILELVGERELRVYLFRVRQDSSRTFSNGPYGSTVAVVD